MRFKIVAVVWMMLAAPSMLHANIQITWNCSHQDFEKSGDKLQCYTFNLAELQRAINNNLRHAGTADSMREQFAALYQYKSQVEVVVIAEQDAKLQRVKDRLIQEYDKTLHDLEDTINTLLASEKKSGETEKAVRKIKADSDKKALRELRRKRLE